MIAGGAQAPNFKNLRGWAPVNFLKLVVLEFTRMDFVDLVLVANMAHPAPSSVLKGLSK